MENLGDAGRNIDKHTRVRAADGDASFGPPAWAAKDCYIAPTREQQKAFADAVKQHGPTNPDGWIEHGNPNYATGDDPWTNNCGPCSRSFADTYQGGKPIAAHGDSIGGEGSEMYDILGAQPEPGLTNPHLRKRSILTLKLKKKSILTLRNLRVPLTTSWEKDCARNPQVQ